METSNNISELCFQGHARPFAKGNTRYSKQLMDSKQHIPGRCIHLLKCVGKGAVLNARSNDVVVSYNGHSSCCIWLYCALR